MLPLAGNHSPRSHQTRFHWKARSSSTYRLICAVHLFESASLARELNQPHVQLDRGFPVYD